MLRVLVADDSPTARALVVSILRSDPALSVVGEAVNGADAVTLAARLRPDVITMDVRMPVLDGFEATRQIMVQSPTPIVIVSGVYDDRDVESSMHALRAGAVAVLPKPPAPGAPDFDDQCRRLLTTVKTMAQVKVVRRWAARSPEAPPPIAIPRRAPAAVIAIAASTGGPGALARVLGDLSPAFPVPVLVVQHIASGFVEGLASWLNTAAALPVRVATDLEPLQSGLVYLAPDDRHLALADRSTICVSTHAAVNGFRPSATMLFESVARAFGAAAVGVMLTGMGDDGVEGLRAVRRAGGTILAQDEASSVVFGMPGATVAAGLADATIPITAIAARLQELTAR